MQLPDPCNSPRPSRLQEAGRLPGWLRKRLPAGGTLSQTRRLLGRRGLATVCVGARCPNLPECWANRTATFMVLGRRCTRQCRFCAVERGEPEPVSADEPVRLAEAAAELGLRHIVITSVTRDDLADEGAGHFHRCVAEVRRRLPDATVEVLTPDFHARAECIETVLSAGPTVFNHNIETVRRLTPAVRPEADYDRSLTVLRIARGNIMADALPSGSRPKGFTKSGMMIGLGEMSDEVLETLADLRSVGCDIVTIGQYLAPRADSAPVQRYCCPEEFDWLAVEARGMGFAAVAAGPFVRSSHDAAELYRQAADRSGTAHQDPV